MNAAATTGSPSPARTWNGSCPGTPTPETSAPGHSRPRPDNRTGTATITASPRTRSRRPLAYPITGLPNTYGPGGWIPAVETEETSDAYVVRAELPGMKREDVNVELRGNELRITGEVKEEQAGKILRHRHGKFAYRSSLPADADSDKIDAELADGILTVRLPKAAQARSRRIEIKG